MDEISERLYMATIFILIFIGVGVSSIGARISWDWQVTGQGVPGYLSLGFFILFGLVLPFGGIIVSVTNHTAGMSFVGYALTAASFGIFLGPFVALYDPASIIYAVKITVLIVGAMFVVGLIAPPIYADLGRLIITMLVILMIGGLAIPFLGGMLGLGQAAYQWWSIIGVVVFAGLVAYDINKAMQLPKTFDNAVDSAVALYLDVINIFVRVLAASNDD